MSTAERRQRLEQMTRVFLRPIGTPVPLGFIALAVASLVVAGLELSWFPKSESHAVGWLLIVFPFPLQLVACVFAFLGRDGPVASAMGTLACSWLAIGIIHLTSPPSATNPALGVLLFVVAGALLLTAAASATGKLVPALVIVTTAVRFSLTAAHEVSHGESWGDAAGVVGCVLCGLALYAAFALEVNDARRQSTLPVLRRGLGKEAFEGDLVDQVTLVDRDAGVREQL